MRGDRIHQSMRGWPRKSSEGCPLVSFARGTRHAGLIVREVLVRRAQLETNQVTLVEDKASKLERIILLGL